MNFKTMSKFIIVNRLKFLVILLFTVNVFGMTQKWDSDIRDLLSTVVFALFLFVIFTMAIAIRKQK